MVPREYNCSHEKWELNGNATDHIRYGSSGNLIDTKICFNPSNPTVVVKSNSIYMLSSTCRCDENRRTRHDISGISPDVPLFFAFHLRVIEL